jgi:hypothetical protein
MTQNEYVFTTISVILGLSITRLLNAIAGLIRAHKRVTFHWATALYAASVMAFILQLWWVGWELRTSPNWTIVDFFVLVIGAIFVYGSAELALPREDYDIADNSELDFKLHSQTLGRLSALSMLGYFFVGPYVNLKLFENSVLASVGFPVLGASLMLFIALRPAWFSFMSVAFFVYALVVLYLTA